MHPCPLGRPGGLPCPHWDIPVGSHVPSWHGDIPVGSLIPSQHGDIPVGSLILSWHGDIPVGSLIPFHPGAVRGGCPSPPSSSPSPRTRLSPGSASLPQGVRARCPFLGSFRDGKAKRRGGGEAERPRGDVAGRIIPTNPQAGGEEGWAGWGDLPGPGGFAFWVRSSMPGSGSSDPLPLPALPMSWG